MDDIYKEFVQSFASDVQQCTSDFVPTNESRRGMYKAWILSVKASAQALVNAQKIDSISDDQLNVLLHGLKAVHIAEIKRIFR